MSWRNKRMADDAFIENRTFDEIRIGDTASVSRTLSEKDIQLFALVPGDAHPPHLDADLAPTALSTRLIPRPPPGGAPPPTTARPPSPHTTRHSLYPPAPPPPPKHP